MCNNTFYYAMYFTKTLKDWIIFIITTITCLGLIPGIIDIITISMKLDFEKNQIKNLINSEQQILIFIRDFLSLVNNLHFINLESSKFNLISFSNITYILNVRHRRVVYPKYFDLYQILSFTKILIPLMYHIFLMNYSNKI